MVVEDTGLGSDCLVYILVLFIIVGVLGRLVVFFVSFFLIAKRESGLSKCKCLVRGLIVVSIRLVFI